MSDNECRNFLCAFFSLSDSRLFRLPVVSSAFCNLDDDETRRRQHELLWRVEWNVCCSSTREMIIVAFKCAVKMR